VKSLPGGPNRATHRLADRKKALRASRYRSHWRKQADHQNRLIWINTNFQVKNSRRLDMKGPQLSSEFKESSRETGEFRSKQNASLKHFHSHEESGSVDGR
jgi:hypothetical protein